VINITIADLFNEKNIQLNLLICMCLKILCRIRSHFGSIMYVKRQIITDTFRNIEKKLNSRKTAHLRVEPLILLVPEFQEVVERPPDGVLHVGVLARPDVRLPEPDVAPDQHGRRGRHG